VRPLSKLSLPVKVTGAKPGEDAFVTVAAVDIGILNLTRFESPDPSSSSSANARSGTICAISTAI
jgi:uncharacterized protein YfaS (alpha-2-macroglobulin family)